MNPRIGVLSIGLSAYWSQFAGLRERLEGYQADLVSRLRRPGIEVVSAGLVDSVETGQAAAELMRGKGVECIFLHLATYATSSTIVPLLRRSKTPIVVLNLVPGAAIDYEAFSRLPNRAAMTGEWLAHCGPCSAPELSNVFFRAGVPFHEVVGRLHGDDACWDEIGEWVDAARVAGCMARNRLGLMGHGYEGMLDVATDTTLQSLVFGTTLVQIEVDELSLLRTEVTGAQIARRVEVFHETFEIQPDCPQSELERAARTSVALDRLVEEKRLGAMAYFHSGTAESEHGETIRSIILGNSLLTARGIPIAGEYEVKNVQAMKIMDLFGAGGSFTEYYALDFDADVVLMGHDGPGHCAIAEGRTRVRPLDVYHGKVGNGLSVEMSVKHGPVTLLSVVESGHGRLEFLVAEGESVPGPILEIGNTNSRYRFPCGARRFVQQWNARHPAHHCAIGTGHIASKIRKLGALLDIETVCVGI